VAKHRSVREQPKSRANQNRDVRRTEVEPGGDGLPADPSPVSLSLASDWQTMLSLIGLKGVTMSYQTINPSNERKVKVFPEHTDEQLEELITRAQSAYQNDWVKGDWPNARESSKTPPRLC
jgi:hypothetical protein